MEVKFERQIPANEINPNLGSVCLNLEEEINKFLNQNTVANVASDDILLNEDNLGASIYTQPMIGIVTDVTDKYCFIKFLSEEYEHLYTPSRFKVGFLMIGKKDKDNFYVERVLCAILHKRVHESNCEERRD